MVFNDEIVPPSMRANLVLLNDIPAQSKSGILKPYETAEHIPPARLTEARRRSLGEHAERDRISLSRIVSR